MRLFRLLRSIHNGSSGSSSSTSSVATAAASAAGQPEAQNMFRKLFGKYLLLTNTLSAGLLMVAGDLAAQEYEYRSNNKKKLMSDQQQQDELQRVHRIDWTRVGECFCFSQFVGQCP